MTKPRWSFWLIAVFTLIWNAMGCMNFVMQMSPAMLAEMPESHRTIAENRPIWSTVGFALGVFGGTIGALLLLLRRTLARPVFILSLIGVVLATVPLLGMLGDSVHFSAAEMALAVYAPILLAIFLVWYSRFSEKREWIV